MARTHDTALLLATDLDRTLIPNGPQPESPEARPRFRRLVELPGVALVYVTGRHPGLVRQAMRDYALPQPDHVIGDVGTSLYTLDQAGGWHVDEAWQQRLASDWKDVGHGGLAQALATMTPLVLQEAEKQTPLKLSYYAPHDLDPKALLARAGDCLAETGAHCKLVWSVDETTRTGLLDVLPGSAGKYEALDFLRRRLDMPLNRTVFAGDSGNDLDVLASPVPSVLVRNAQPAVRELAMSQARAAGHEDALYLAVGGLGGMNGCYGAGILEGVAHFMPEYRARLGARDDTAGRH